MLRQVYRYYLLPLEEVVPRERDREPRVARLLEIMETKVCIGGGADGDGGGEDPILVPGGRCPGLISLMGAALTPTTALHLPPFAEAGARCLAEAGVLCFAKAGVCW